MMDNQNGVQNSGCVFKNPNFHQPNGNPDDTPMESLRQLQEMFHGKIEDDVVHLLFTESGFNCEFTLYIF